MRPILVSRPLREATRSYRCRKGSHLLHSERWTSSQRSVNMIASHMGPRQELTHSSWRVLCRSFVAMATLNSPTAVAADESASVSQVVESTDSSTQKEPSVQGCVDAHLSAQELRNQGQLLESRSQLLICSREACPNLVRSECLLLLDELRAPVPSVVLRVTVDGAPTSNVRVFVDDQLRFSELPSRALELNPGKHQLRFQHEELPDIERELTIAEGEKLVVVAVAFTSRKAASGTSPGSTSVPSPRAAIHRPVPWSVYALTGLGAAGVAGFVGLGLATRKRENELRGSCSPSCTEAQIDSVRDRATMADVSLLVGGAALALAATVYVLRPAESVQIVAVVTPAGGVQSQLHVRF